jgi:uncharacterized protein (TIGR02444 family)
MDFPSHPFWDFALEVYRKPGVSEACLRLQEDNHVDVNLLLFVCWIGASGCGRLNAQDVARCIDAVGPWHESVVKPLRGVRRILKDELADGGGAGVASPELTQALRRAIQAREIDAEHVEQLMLTATIARESRDHVSAAERLTDAGHNAALYLTRLGKTVRAAEQAHLAVVLAAAFPAMPPAEVQKSLALAGR